jgi:large subunit ribosomal protein L23
MSTTKVNFRDYDVIIRPIITEKSQKQTALAQYTFAVAMDATKPEIKSAIERLMEVKVKSVRTLIRKGKTKVFKGREGRRSDTKRAIVTLVPGQNLDLTAGV